MSAPAHVRRDKRRDRSKLTSAVIERVARLVGSGVFLETAAASAGVSRSTLYEWLKRGAAEEEGLYARFRKAIDKAIANAEIKDWQAIGRATKTDWRAAAWRLSRRHPERFAQRSALQVSSSPTLLESAEADLTRISDEDLEKLEAIAGRYVEDEEISPDS